METERLRLEKYLEDWEFWTGLAQERLARCCSSAAAELDEIDSKHLSPDDLRYLEKLSGNLRINLIEYFASITDRFRWRELSHSEPILFDREPSKFRNPERPFFLGSTSIVDSKKSEKFLLVMHSHAAAALGDDGDDNYIKAAEKFLEETRKPLMSFRTGEAIHGVLMVGGKVAFYEMDGGDFYPVAVKPGVKWLSTGDKEFRTRLLGIVMRAWWTLDPLAFERGIRQPMDGTRIARNGFSWESDSDTDSDYEY